MTGLVRRDDVAQSLKDTSTFDAFAGPIVTPAVMADAVRRLHLPSGKKSLRSGAGNSNTPLARASV
jgi:hypothetical protein